MKWFTFFLLLFLSLNPLRSQAQPALKISDAGVQNWPSLADEDDYATFFFYLKNVGDSSFVNDSLFTYNSVNGGPAYAIDTIFLPSLAPGDSTLIFVSNYQFANAIYNLGKNGVVIWTIEDERPIRSDSAFLSVFIMDGPAFQIGPLGLMNFPAQPDTSQSYNFEIHIENASVEPYQDTVFVNMEVNGIHTRLSSGKEVLISGNSGIIHAVQNYEFTLPPYAEGINQVRIWITGVDEAVAIDTLETSVQIGDLGLSRATDQAIRFQVHPNPVQGSSKLSLPPGILPSSLLLVDGTGREIHRFRSLASGNIDLSDKGLSQGIYYLILNTREGRTGVLKIFFQGQL